VSLIAIGSATHAFDSNQRFLWLTFTRTSTGLSVKAPTKNLAPPGYYMLFILNGNGVPSVGRMIRLH
jgi:galactose oxidase